MTLLELLEAEKVEEFNAKRGRRSAPELFAVDLSGKKLAGVDLSGANLEKADLTEVDLTDAILARANLSGADLSNARLDGIVAVRSKWREAWMEEAIIDGADFSGSDMSEAVLNKTTGDNVSFRNCKLKSAEFRDAKLGDCDFEEARLDNADLGGAALPNANFRESSLSGASFDKATLLKGEFGAVRAANASFVGAALSGANFARADLTAVDLSGSQLDGARLVEADLADAIINGTNFTGADLTRANVGGLDMSLASLDGAKVSGDLVGGPIDDSPDVIHFEDLRGASIGEHVALFWENEDTPHKLVNRFAIVTKDFDGKAPAHPAPAELALSRGIVRIGERFCLAVLVERPAGVELSLVFIDTSGAIVERQTHRLDYQPALRPVLSAEDGTLVLLGVGKRGPTIYRHTLTPNGLELSYGVRASTARGLVGERDLMLVTRGGVMMPIGSEGLGKPLQEPKGFDARLASCCELTTGWTVAWLPPGKPGFCHADLKPQKRPETEIRCREETITCLELCTVNDRPVAFFCKEEEESLGACGVWQLWLDEFDKPSRVLVDARFDVDEVKVLGVEGTRVMLLCRTLSDEVVLMAVDGTEPEILAQLP